MPCSTASWRTSQTPPRRRHGPPRTPSPACAPAAPRGCAWHSTRRSSESRCSTLRPSWAGRGGARSTSSTCWVVCAQPLHLIAAEGRLPAEEVDVLAHMMLAAVSEAALLIARAEDPERALAEGQAAVDLMIDRLTAGDRFRHRRCGVPARRAVVRPDVRRPGAQRHRPRVARRSARFDLRLLPPRDHRRQADEPARRRGDGRDAERDRGPDRHGRRGGLGRMGIARAGRIGDRARSHSHVSRRRCASGDGADPIQAQIRLARSIGRDHLVCLAAIVSLLAIQLAAGG